MRVRVIAGAALVQARLSTVLPAIRVMGFHSDNDLSPSRRLRLGIVDREIEPVTAALVESFRANETPAGDNWSAEEDAVVIAGTAAGEGPAEIARKLVGRSRHAVKSRRIKLGLPSVPRLSLSGKRLGRTEASVPAVLPPPGPVPAPPVGLMTAAEGWSERRLAALKQHHADNLSAAQSAKLLGAGTTRNAVIAKRHRLGLTEAACSDAHRIGAAIARKQQVKRAAPPRPVPRLVKPEELEKPRSSPEPIAPTLPEERPFSGRLMSLEKLGAHNCKWPVGDPQKTGFGFCGRYKAADDTYCDDHARVAYQPQVKKPGKSGRDRAAELLRSVRRYA